MPRHAVCVPVALTDHDTTVGLTEAQQAANEIGIELVHGVELATWLDKTEFHIVGLDINENNPHFQTAMARMQQIREDRNNQMVARMQAPVWISPLRNFTPKKASVF